MTTTTVPPSSTSRAGYFLSLILAAAALTAASTWLVVSVVIDGATDDRVVTTAPPPVAAPTVSPIAAKDRPISVANAYHGIGVTFCLDNKHPVTRRRRLPRGRPRPLRLRISAADRMGSWSR